MIKKLLSGVHFNFCSANLQRVTKMNTFVRQIRQWDRQSTCIYTVWWFLLCNNIVW